MSEIERFASYAAAFERAYESDDWSVVEPFFHEDALYVVALPAPFGGRFEGRAAILAYFERILNGFDRRFETRTVTLLEGPRLEDGSVWLRGRAAYTAAGVPDVAFDLEELATFEGNRIRRLEDRYSSETATAIGDWLEVHAATLGIER